MDEAGIVPDQSTSVEDHLYSFTDHQAFIETAKSMNLPPHAYNDKIGDKDQIHQNPAPLNLAPLSPSFVEKGWPSPHLYNQKWRSFCVNIYAF